MHHYELCNYKTHNTPKRDQKPLHRTPNYHPSVHFRKSLKNAKPHWKFLNNCPASACYPHNDWFLAGRLLLYFLMATVPTVGGFPVCSCSCSGHQATFSSAIPLCAQSVKISEVWYQMNWSNRCWPTIPLGIMIENFWKPGFIIRKYLGVEHPFTALWSNSSWISLIASSPAGQRMPFGVR